MFIDSDDKKLSQNIHDLLIQSNKTVATAESCTCGRIASTIGCVPEAALYLQGGLVAYQNEIKT